MCELRNCPVCNSLFTFNGNNTVCQGCFENDYKNFHKVRDYINDHPGCDFVELTTAIGLKEETLFRYIREGRLIYHRKS